jgi:eukaryotic-like serine/threonine-protein kinase
MRSSPSVRTSGQDSFDSLLARVAEAPPVDDAYALRTLPPDTIVGGRYRIVDVLGRGGTAVVYRARSLELRRVVAIKILSVGADLDRLRRLRAEASTMARLSHPHVLAVMDVGTHEGQLFLVVEHVDAGTLRDWLSSPRPVEAVLDAFIQAGEGLAAAHRIGVVHRDFKPDNALIGRDGRVRVSDFGLARGLELASEVPSILPPGHTGDLDTPRTATGLVHGTPAYMAPEQLEGHAADAASDQFAFCVAVWEALHGQRPFAARTLDELRTVTREGRIQPSRGAAVPRRIERVLLRGLRPLPKDRFSSMEELLHALRGASRPRVSTAKVATLVALVGLGAFALARTTDAVECAAPDLSGVWDDATREAAARAFERTAVPGVAEAWLKTREELDAYAGAWVLARGQTCAAAQESTGASDGDLDLRLACLRRRRNDLTAVAGVLAEADKGVVRNAADLVSRLLPVSDCDDVEALRRDPVQPADPRIAAAVEALRARLSIATANATAGRFPTGIAIAQEVTDSARGLDYAPLQADALLVLGTTASKQGRHEEANEAMRQAYFVATSAGHDRAAFVAAAGLTARLGRSGAELDESLEWHATADALVRRLGDGPRMRAELEGARAEAYYTHARGPEAITGFRRALALLEAHDPEDALLVPVRTTLANVLLLEGRHAECVEVAAAGVEIASTIYGDAHTSTAMVLGTLAQCRALAGDAAAAEAPARRAVEILEAAQGRLSMNVADAYDALENVLRAQGKIDEAIEANARVREIQDALNPHDTYNRAAALGGLARLLAARGDLDEAEATLQQAFDIAREDTQAPAHLREALEALQAEIRAGANAEATP